MVPPLPLSLSLLLTILSPISNSPFLCFSCQGYRIVSLTDGGPTCVAVAAQTTSVTYTSIDGDTCQSVSLAFQLSASSLQELNPFLQCAAALPAGEEWKNWKTPAVASAYDSPKAIRPKPLPLSPSLPSGLVLTVGDTTPSSLQCTSAAITAASDSCSSFARRNSISVSTLSTLNPSLKCPGQLSPSLQLCVSGSLAPSSAPTAKVGASCGQTATALTSDTCLTFSVRWGLTQLQLQG